MNIKGKRLSTQQVITRFELAQRKKDIWEDLYSDAYEFAIPQRQLYGYYEGSSQGQKKMTRVFDSTAIHSTARFANRMQSGVFPPQRRSCRLEPGNQIPFEQQAEVQSVLDQYTDTMFSVLKNSNFDIAMGEFLLDLSVGTAVMMIQPGNETSPINFIPIPLFLVSFEEGANGEIDKVYRKMRMKGEAITQQWTDAKLPESVATRIKNKPFVISRYMKVAGEIYGRGLLLTALPDIKTLNKTKELLLKNATLSVMPVFTAQDDGVLNPHTVKIVPGAIIPVARNGGSQGESLRPLPRAGDFNVSQLIINDLRMSIKQILLDESLPPDNMSARSATEIVERMKELSQNLGSAFGRLINETMIPIVDKTLAVMDERGMINLPLQVNGLEVKVSPSSPLAMAQNMEEINSIVQFIDVPPEGMN